MLFDEETLTLKEAAAVLPRFNGRRPHVSTIWRWARKGVRGVKLEVVRVGGQYLTSKQALERFAEQLAEVDHEAECKTPHKTGRGPRSRRRTLDQVEHELDEAGL